MIFGFGKKSKLFEKKKEWVQDRHKKQYDRLKEHTDEDGRLMTESERKGRKGGADANENKQSTQESDFAQEGKPDDRAKEQDLRDAGDALHEGLGGQEVYQEQKEDDADEDQELQEAA